MQRGQRTSWNRPITVSYYFNIQSSPSLASCGFKLTFSKYRVNSVKDVESMNKTGDYLEIGTKVQTFYLHEISNIENKSSHTLSYQTNRKQYVYPTQKP